MKEEDMEQKMTTFKFCVQVNINIYIMSLFLSKFKRNLQCHNICFVFFITHLTFDYIFIQYCFFRISFRSLSDYHILNGPYGP